jgi:hypothetical protein
MQDKEAYQHILGLTSPWTVSEVKLDIPAKEIHVTVSTPLVQSSAVLSGGKTLLATIRQRSVDGSIWTRANTRQFSLAVFPEWTVPSMELRP